MDNSLRAFFRFRRAIEDEIRSVRISLFGIQEQIRVISNQQAAYFQAQNAEQQRPQVLHAELQVSEHVELDRRAIEHRQHCVQVWLTVGTWLAFIAAAVYAGITYYQSRLTRTALKDNQNSFTLMQRQVEAAVSAAVQKQFIIGWPSNKAYLSVVLSNRGKTVASNVKGRLRLEIGRIRDGEFTGRDWPPWNFYATEVFPDPEMPIVRGKYLDISEGEFSSTSGVPKTIKLTGEISYFNGFDIQSRSVCYYVLGDMIFKNRAGVVQATQGASSIPCDEVAQRLADFWKAKQDYFK
jgi:hypothetical protein